MKLLLFDIDGTLLKAAHVGRRAVEEALREVTDQAISAGDLPFSGKTDPQIVRELLTRAGFEDGAIGKLTPDILHAYADRLEEKLGRSDVVPMPGVEELLRKLAPRPDVQLAVLTGNLERTAYLKLEAAGLDSFFPFGAFSSDTADRNALPPVAIRRAEAHTGQRFAGRDVAVIGDTGHDIRCGQEAGALTVAVCTGRYSHEELIQHQPDLLFRDLTNHAAFIQHVLDHR